MSLDLTGLRVGSITALEPTEERKNGYVIWRCRCDCGKEVLIDLRRLQRGTARDCGCGLGGKRELPQDLTGARFGMLTVLRETGASTSQGRLWLCQCDCGEQVELPAPLLRAGIRRSCGCINRAKLNSFLGKRFGMLTVMGYNGKLDGSHMWLCQCDCGKRLDVKQEALQSGSVTTCGEHPDIRSVVEPERETDKRFPKRVIPEVRGVYQGKTTHKWVAQITYETKTYYLGSYAQQEDAIAARKEAESHVGKDFPDWYRQLKSKI